MFYKFLEWLDKIFCIYIGIQANDQEKPRTVKLINNKLFLTKNHIFQRHRHIESLDFTSHFHRYSGETTKQIGAAAGKAMAKNLLITFDKIEIKK